MKITNHEIRELEKKWKNTWGAIDANTSGDREFKELVDIYEKPGREYHNLMHIYNSLEETEEITGLLKNPEQVKIAIFYHDAIYKPDEKDNEENIYYKTFARRISAKVTFNTERRKARSRNRIHYRI